MMTTDHAPQVLPKSHQRKPGKGRLVPVYVLLALAIISPLSIRAHAAQEQHGGEQFKISYSAAANPGPITGRLVLVLAAKNDREPRLTVAPNGPAIFGADIDHLQPAQITTLDATTIGYPSKLSDLPPGDYYAQAVIDVYTQVHRADGHTIWVHMNDCLLYTSRCV